MEELLKALKTIKNECESHDICDEQCPLYIRAECGLNLQPYDWSLVDKVPKPTLFKED